MKAEIIELKGRGDRIELALSTLMAPLWGFVFPLLACSSIVENLWAFFIISVACFFCFLHYLHLSNTKFTVEETGIRMPGVDHRLVPLSAISKVGKWDWPSLMIDAKFVRGKERWELFDCKHLTPDGAERLCEFLTSKLPEGVLTDELRAGLEIRAKELQPADRDRGLFRKFVKVAVRIWIYCSVLSGLVAYSLFFYDFVFGSHDTNMAQAFALAAIYTALSWIFQPVVAVLAAVIGFFARLGIPPSLFVLLTIFSITVFGPLCLWRIVTKE